MATLSYKCPQCGAELHYDGVSDLMKCDYCEGTFPTSDLIVGEEVIGETRVGTGEDGLELYTCPACGAELVTDATTAADKCPYCGNNVVHSDRLSGDFHPDFVIPFATGAEQAKESLRQFYKGKILMPKSFKSENKISEMKGVYVPYWLFTGDADGDTSFNAEKVRVWSDGTNRYTETKHYKLFRSGRFSFSDVPHDGSTKADDRYMEAVEPFDYSAAVEYSPAYLSGFLADKYDVTAEDCVPRVRGRVENSLVASIENTITGYDNKTLDTKNINVRMSRKKYVLMPVWMLSTEYRGKIFRFAMNGQTGKFVGEAPVSWPKFWAWFLGLSTVLSAIALLIAYFLTK